MRYAIIEHNKVVNLAIAEYALADNWIQSDTAAIGDDFVNGKIVPQPAPSAPPRSRTLTKLQFLRLMTQEERMAFRAAAKVNPVMEDFMALLDLAMDVDKDDPDVVSGLQKAEQAGLLASGRAAEILS